MPFIRILLTVDRFVLEHTKAGFEDLRPAIAPTSNSYLFAMASVLVPTLSSYEKT